MVFYLAFYDSLVTLWLTRKTIVSFLCVCLVLSHKFWWLGFLSTPLRMSVQKLILASITLVSLSLFQIKSHHDARHQKPASSDTGISWPSFTRERQYLWTHRLCEVSVSQIPSFQTFSCFILECYPTSNDGGTFYFVLLMTQILWSFVKQNWPTLIVATWLISISPRSVSFPFWYSLFWKLLPFPRSPLNFHCVIFWQNNTILSQLITLHNNVWHFYYFLQFRISWPSYQGHA